MWVPSLSVVAEAQRFYGHVTGDTYLDKQISNPLSRSFRRDGKMFDESHVPGEALP